MIGEIQCTDGRAVHANQNSPIGTRTLPTHIAETAASGAGLPVLDSGGCIAINFRIKGSKATAMAVPAPIPQ